MKEELNRQNTQPGQIPGQAPGQGHPPAGPEDTPQSEGPPPGIPAILDDGPLSPVEQAYRAEAETRKALERACQAEQEAKAALERALHAEQEMEKAEERARRAEEREQSHLAAMQHDEARWDKRTHSKHWHHLDVNHGQSSFAAGLNFYKLVWVFLLGCIIGVVFETIAVYIFTGTWMRRSGMLYGPFNQIYGFGAVLLTLLLYRFRKKNAFFIFLASTIIGGAFEFVCSWLQELVFGSVSWEYSNIVTNIAGRTNLLYSFVWGFLGLLFITHIWPFLSELIERIPNTIWHRVTGRALTILVAVLFLINLLLSGAAVYRANQRAKHIPATGVFTAWLDATYPDAVIAEKFPSMTFVGASAPKQTTPKTNN